MTAEAIVKAPAVELRNEIDTWPVEPIMSVDYLGKAGARYKGAQLV